MAHINPGDNPFFQRWRGSPELLIVAFDQAMIDRVGTEIFGKVGAMLRPTVGSVDRNIRNALPAWTDRSEEHTSELQSLMRISYAVFCLKKKNKTIIHIVTIQTLNY